MRQHTVHPLFHWRRDMSPLGFLGRAISIAVVSTLLTLILPGLIAARGGVFYKADMVARLPREPRQRLETFERAQRQRQAAEDQIVSDVLSQKPGAAASDQLWDVLSKDAARAEPPVAVIPFYLNPQMLMWPAIYTCLLWIAIIMTPDPKLSFAQILLSRKTLELGVVTYIFYEWPLWLRNFVLTSEGRVVYGYPNIDIHVASFVTQEGIVFGFCVLLAIIWRQWSIYLVHNQHDDPTGKPGPEHLAVLTDPSAATSFAEVFVRWAECSTVLALGFIGLTTFYWNLVGKYHDQRYLLSAILAHVLWGITWIMFSMPLRNEWLLWNRCRTFAVQFLASDVNVVDKEARLAIIKGIQPVTAGTLKIANVASLVSFVLPMVQAFIK